MAQLTLGADGRGRLKRRAIGLGALVTLLLAAWVGGLAWFADQVPRRVDDTTSATDAIVVLTGGSARIDAGFQLLSNGLGRKLFVSGVYRGVEVNELLRLARQVPREVDCCVALGYTADDTTGNARETAEWMNAEGFRSLRLVTANYHMRRSLYEFRRAMPDIDIVPHPVFPKNVKREQWWLWPGTAKLITSEYNKYLLAVVRRWLGLGSVGGKTA
jgi:uncharacterized SAM-binding protein YcdF (DUF218 family)